MKNDIRVESHKHISFEIFKKSKEEKAKLKKLKKLVKNQYNMK